LGAPVAFVEKRREGGQTESLTVIGDVRDKNVIIVDDEVDRGTTIAGDAHILHQAGAKDVYACFVHPTFSDHATELLAAAHFKEIVCTNTEPIPPHKMLPNLTVIHLGPWLSEIIDAVNQGLSVGKRISEYQPDLE
jgi:ribose-phosphate pyrophosphokinase